jgi:GNAT superfamily N-acetyltransferase
MPVVIRPGDPTDFEAAVGLFERSNLARRNGLWPNRLASVARCRESVRGPDSWLLVAEEASVLVGMASAQPMRADDGAGPVVPGGCFLSYLYVVPERWGEGIGGRILDAVLADAERRGYSRIRLWTHEDNARSHRLYRSRGFSPTGRVAADQAEWQLSISSRHDPAVKPAAR